MAMQPIGEGTAMPAAAALAGAWRDWWALAGVDEAVAAEPHGWLAATAALRPAARPGPLPTPDAAPDAETPDVENWAGFADLPAFLARVRATAPRCPIADGDPASGIVLVGDAPAAEDLRSGRPFSGPAGQLLERMLASIGLDRGSVYITLLAPRRRIPGAAAASDLAADRALTAAHLTLLRPRLLLLLGRAASEEIGGATGAIGAYRGQWRPAPGLGVPALPTFNPAYLLLRPAEKAAAWADLLALKRRIAM